MTHQEITKHFRNRLRHEGIVARCSLYTGCGVRCIRISPPSAEARFNESEERTIRMIAKAVHLTHAHGSEIDVERMTGSVGEVFEFHG